ncbi:MAG: hypothetical protein AAGH89_12135 [Verrucomicrobiota bacterium]
MNRRVGPDRDFFTNDEVKFTPNEDYWKPIPAFWEFVKESGLLCDELCDYSFECLPQWQKERVAKLYYAAARSTPNDRRGCAIEALHCLACNEGHDSAREAIVSWQRNYTKESGLNLVEELSNEAKS